MFLLICILVLALQSQSLIKELDESHSLTLMVYTHFFFLVLRLIVGWMGLMNLLLANIEGGITSLLFSFDTILCVTIYFGEKFFAIFKAERRQSRSNDTFGVNLGTNGGVFVTTRGSVISGLKGSGKQKYSRLLFNHSLRSTCETNEQLKLSKSLCVTKKEKQQLQQERHKELTNSGTAKDLKPIGVPFGVEENIEEINKVSSEISEVPRESTNSHSLYKGKKEDNNAQINDE